MKKMLIVEDDQIVGSIYRHKFQMEGFQVELAHDGDAGLKAVASFEPDIVILDLMLPKLNGVEVLKRLREKPATKTLPVIVLTNAYMSSLVQEAWKAGANHCMIKASCTPKQLVELVHKAVAAASGSAAAPPIPARSGETASQPTARPVVPEDDTAFQTELRQTFLKSATESLSELRALLQAFAKGEGDTERLPRLFALYRKVHSITSNAAVAGLASIAKMSSALEALLKELYEKPKNINSSTIRTIAHTIDFLAMLHEPGSASDTDGFPPANLLVVDDGVISRREVTYALEKANLKCVSVEDPDTALKMLSENKFDLIFLDVDMPGMSGFDLCAKLRALPQHARTPVVFVTGLTD